MKLHTKQRDVDFINAAKIVLGCYPPGSFPTVREIADRTLKLKAPRYYVEPEYAYKQIVKIRSKGVVPQRDGARDLWCEIFFKVMKRMKNVPSESLYDAVFHVVLFEGASSFFMSQGHAMRLLNRSRTRRHYAEVKESKSMRRGRYLFERFLSIEDLLS